MKLSALMPAQRRRPPFLAITVGLGAAAVLAAGGAVSAQARTGSETAAGAAVTGTASHRAPAATAARAPAGTWRKLPAAPITKSPEGGMVSVWTGHEMIIHGIHFPPAGGIRGVTFAYRPATRTWVRLANGPSRPSAFETTDVAVWTGSRMLVPGQTSGIYNPVTNTWREMALAPMSLYGAVTGWTGHRFLAWGGACCEDTSHDGAAYNPATNTWRKLPTAPLAPRADASGAWTGKELVVAGGSAGHGSGARIFRSGAAYNPSTHTWRRLPLMPRRPVGGPALWDGKEILFLSTSSARGMAYNPVKNSWRLLPAMPLPRSGFAAVWTGHHVLIWGGLSGRFPTWAPPPRGEAYNPATNQWSALPASPLHGRASPVAVWTGHKMIVWGGNIPRETTTRLFTDGAAYTPRTP